MARKVLKLFARGLKNRGYSDTVRSARHKNDIAYALAMILKKLSKYSQRGTDAKDAEIFEGIPCIIIPPVILHVCRKTKASHNNEKYCHERTAAQEPAHPRDYSAMLQ